MGMKTKSFMIYNTIGSIVRATSMILIGVIFVKNYETIIDYLGYVVLGSLVVGGIYVYFFKKAAFMHYWEEKNKEIDERIEASNRK
jgi:membrane protein DedA with SNARE-associated domain